MSDLVIAKYVRKPFEVEAVLVTEENMTKAAAWCEGDIRETTEGVKYIKVQVYRPANVRQTRAFAGDWILQSGKDYFKVFMQKPFESSFEPKK